MLRKHTQLLSVLVLVCACAPADNIHLKNGTSIAADKVIQKGDHVEYVVGSTTYWIPQSSVDHIERTGGTFGISVGNAPPGAAYRDPDFSAGTNSTAPPGATAHGKLAAAPPSTGPMGGAGTGLRARVITLGRVDSRALYEIEKEGNPGKSAAAYFEAARYELEQNDYDSARKYLRQSLKFAPDHPSLIGLYVVLLMQAGKYDEAVRQAEHMTRLAPNSADSMRLLGLAYYNADRLADAIRAWERAQQIQPTEAVQQYLAKAQREARVEDSFTELQSPHFSLRFEGRQPGFALRSDLLRTLERQYNELSRELGFAPQANITVFLYTDKQFFDVTQAPSWANGLNDGKLRIPVADVSGMTPGLEHVLKHELSHSFVHFRTHGRCPRWLDEGIAQMVEGRTASSYREELGQMFASGKQLPLPALEYSFIRFNREQAVAAYVESLAATEFIRSKYGMTGLQRMLQLISERESGEAALRAITQSGYREFEKDLGAYLRESGAQ
ncbi:MAG: tetratricopeptide repeat protein [Terriglobales bacterium]